MCDMSLRGDERGGLDMRIITSTSTAAIAGGASNQLE